MLLMTLLHLQHGDWQRLSQARVLLMQACAADSSWVALRRLQPPRPSLNSIGCPMSDQTLVGPQEQRQVQATARPGASLRAFTPAPACCQHAARSSGTTN